MFTDMKEISPGDSAIVYGITSSAGKKEFLCWVFSKTNNEAACIVYVLKIVTINAELSLSSL
jgi:hypothetical protein